MYKLSSWRHFQLYIHQCIIFNLRIQIVDTIQHAFQQFIFDGSGNSCIKHNHQSSRNKKTFKIENILISRDKIFFGFTFTIHLHFIDIHYHNSLTFNKINT